MKFFLVEIFPIIMAIALGAIGFWGVHTYNKQQPKEENK